MSEENFNLEENFMKLLDWFTILYKVKCNRNHSIDRLWDKIEDGCELFTATRDKFEDHRLRELPKEKPCEIDMAVVPPKEIDCREFDFYYTKTAWHNYLFKLGLCQEEHLYHPNLGNDEMSVTDLLEYAAGLTLDDAKKIVTYELDKWSTDTDAIRKSVLFGEYMATNEPLAYFAWSKVLGAAIHSSAGVFKNPLDVLRERCAPKSCEEEKIFTGMTIERARQLLDRARVTHSLVYRYSTVGPDFEDYLFKELSYSDRVAYLKVSIEKARSNRRTVSPDDYHSAIMESRPYAIRFKLMARRQEVVLGQEEGTLAYGKFTKEIYSGFLKLLPTPESTVADCGASIMLSSMKSMHDCVPKETSLKGGLGSLYKDQIEDENTVMLRLFTPEQSEAIRNFNPVKAAEALLRAANRANSIKAKIEGKKPRKVDTIDWRFPEMRFLYGTIPHEAMAQIQKVCTTRKAAMSRYRDCIENKENGNLISWDDIPTVPTQFPPAKPQSEEEKSEVVMGRIGEYDAKPITDGYSSGPFNKDGTIKPGFEDWWSRTFSPASMARYKQLTASILKDFESDENIPAKPVEESYTRIEPSPKGGTMSPYRSRSLDTSWLESVLKEDQGSYQRDFFNVWTVNPQYSFFDPKDVRKCWINTIKEHQDEIAKRLKEIDRLLEELK